MAWAVNWAFGQPEAAVLLEELPEMEIFGLLCAVFVGAFSLAVRQGWGLVVAVANGVWAGVLTIGLSGIVYTVYLGSRSLGVVGSFERWLILLQEDMKPLFEQMLNFPLMLMTIAACAVVGLVTEAVHWALVRLRKARGDHVEEHGTTTIRGNPRELW